jgi:hypothetical protein
MSPLSCIVLYTNTNYLYSSGYFSYIYLNNMTLVD